MKTAVRLVLAATLVMACMVGFGSEAQAQGDDLASLEGPFAFTISVSSTYSGSGGHGLPWGSRVGGARDAAGGFATWRPQSYVGVLEADGEGGLTGRRRALYQRYDGVNTTRSGRPQQLEQSFTGTYSISRDGLVEMRLVVAEPWAFGDAGHEYGRIEEDAVEILHLTLRQGGRSLRGVQERTYRLVHDEPTTGLPPVVRMIDHFAVEMESRRPPCEAPVEPNAVDLRVRRR